MIMIDKTNAILGFNGEYSFLSNMYSCEVIHRDRLFPSSEHAYIYERCDPWNNDLHEVYKKLLILSPKEAKKFGRNETIITPAWDVIKKNKMYQIVYEKFSQNEDLKKKLIDTGDAYIEETNYWKDTYWGVCDGRGQNKLGEILMIVRNSLLLESVFK